MQLIQELTLVQKAGVFIGIPLILLFMLVAARRRRAAAAGAGAAVATAAKPKRGRAKKDSAIPRRKRRKLAAEAAQSLGTPPPVPHAVVPEPAVPVVEPVAVSEATPAPPSPEPEAAPLAPPVPVAATPVDDPYVQDIAFAEEQVAAFAEDTLPEVVVAAPGWPTPGELASSFDPDAFDPLPAAEPAPQAAEALDDVPDEVVIDEEPEQPTGVIDMPAVHGDAYVEQDEPEIGQWDGEFDPATGWGEVEAPVPVAVAAESEEWYDSDHAAVGGGSSLEQPNPVDMDQFWTEADAEEPWSDSSEVEILADMVEDAGVPDWVHDDAPAAWEVNATDAVAPAPPSPHDEGGWTMAAPAHGSPVVLDLAGLAASGHSLELVIESCGDGKGVRLRFGSPSTADAPVVDVEPERELEEPQAEMEPEAEYTFGTEAEIDMPAADHEIVLEIASRPAFDDFDVAFLTGGTIDMATASTQSDEPLGADPVAVEMPAEVELHSAWVAEEIVEEDVNQPEPQAEAAPAPAALPDDELTEDPAQILAEIRARLAALDRRS